MSKIDIDKFVASWIKRCSGRGYAGEGLTSWYDSILAEQGLTYKNGEIVSIEFDVPETDYEKKNKDAIRAIKQALRQLTTNGVPVGNMIEAIKDIEEKNAESEDERIRKALISQYQGDGCLCNNENRISYKEILAWLEKQGEQKSIYDLTQQEAMDIAVGKCFEQGEHKPVVIPKFRVGDIIKATEDGEVFTIRTITKDKYIYTDDSFDWIKDQDEYELVEQKPVDKAEPKFKVGDTVTVKPMSCNGKVFKGKPFKIVDIIEDNYVSDDGKTYSSSLQDGWELVEQKPTDEEMKELLHTEYEKGRADAREQMMAKAIDVTVYIDAGGYPYIPQMELYDYDKDIPLAKVGDKVKLIVIKEDSV